MAQEFIKPLFKDRSLELRFENDVVCIYGTKDGLLRLSDLIQSLVESPGRGHIHIEDAMHGHMTDRSEDGAIAIFDPE
jgi:hypothetical protein